MSSFDLQYSMWPQQRAERERLDDDFGTPRAVEHFAYFRWPRRAGPAASELTAAGFVVESGRRGSKTMLKATRHEPLSDEDVTRFLREVIAIVERNGGDYDGWGATVEAPPPHGDRG